MCPIPSAKVYVSGTVLDPKDVVTMITHRVPATHEA